MQKTTVRNTVIIVAVTVIVGGVVAWKTIKALQPREYELQTATITKLDLDQRTGEITFVHPSGRTMKIAARIPDDCAILVDDEEAPLSALKVGDTVSVRGWVYADYSVEPTHVRLTRRGAATQPAAQLTDPNRG